MSEPTEKMRQAADEVILELARIAKHPDRWVTDEVKAAHLAGQVRAVDGIVAWLRGEGGERYRSLYEAAAAIERGDWEQKE